LAKCATSARVLDHQGFVDFHDPHRRLMAGLVVEAVAKFGISGRADLEPENDQD